LFRSIFQRLRNDGQPKRLAFLGATPAERPTGAVIWVHAPKNASTAQIAALNDLRAALADAASDNVDQVTLLLTGLERLGERDAPVPDVSSGDTSDGPTAANSTCIIYTAAPRSLREAKRFVAHWAPDFALWIGHADPIPARFCADLGIPNALVDLDASALKERTSRTNLSSFDHVFTTEIPESASTRTIGPAHVHRGGPMAPDPVLPKCNEGEAEYLASHLQGRPLWLAACPSDSEIADVIAAHAAACQQVHRLLLILVLQTEQIAPQLEVLRRANWQLRQRDIEGDPDPTCQIFVVDGIDELGLWYRLAPLTFLGGGLSDTGLALDPMAPAAMGTALISGPNGGAWQSQLTALLHNGAARYVSRGSHLTRAVTDLLGPDQAALLARNGWDIATQGALLQNELVALILSAVQQAHPQPPAPA
jgi:3-deoxy-D-manno-octulosonic-acid transferase